MRVYEYDTSQRRMKYITEKKEKLLRNKCVCVFITIYNKDDYDKERDEEKRR